MRKINKTKSPIIPGAIQINHPPFRLQIAGLVRFQGHHRLPQGSKSAADEM